MIRIAVEKCHSLEFVEGQQSIQVRDFKALWGKSKIVLDSL